MNVYVYLSDEGEAIELGRQVGESPAATLHVCQDAATATLWCDLLKQGRCPEIEYVGAQPA